MVLHWSLLMTLRSFAMFLCVLSSANFSVNQGNSKKSVFSPWHCDWRLFWVFPAFVLNFPEFEAPHTANALFLQVSHCKTVYENILAWEGVLRVVTAKLTRLTWKIVMQWHLVAEGAILHILSSSSEWGSFQVRLHKTFLRNWGRVWYISMGILPFIAALLNKLPEVDSILTCIWDMSGLNFDCEMTVLNGYFLGFPQSLQASMPG